ncbi:MAG: NAD(P)-dependent oxidoreductase [Acidimicrobiales bacterium]|nr:NAD(P)-dependent oxidoreductase [Acidimicrobiales bacterium]
MKVFVAGATGVLGRRTVAGLLTDGAQVTALARTEGTAAALDRLGATPAPVSLFEPAALAAAVAGHDVVVNLATAIPTGERANDLGAWDDNDRIRREGSRNLVDAALDTGAGRYVQESIALLYADGGDAWLDESALVEPTAITACALAAEAEAARFSAVGGGESVALRFAYLYGHDSAHTVEAVAAARAGAPYEIGPPAAFRPVVTNDDAAAAVVASLDAPGGLYNVADDDPLRRSEHAEVLARALGGAPVAPLDVEMPPPASMLVRSQRVSSERFRATTGWRPRHPSAREGWPAVLTAP